ncbi:MAG TPA: DNA translocase FtsK 4TM domain-containing protein, partial [Rhizomicrobium sp.]|nr:DNA translocase FtsK 4TM domain-containing protein [Rhizomicrobium sp.]
MSQSRMIGGVYHPRARGSAMSEALADARAALARLLRILVMRGAGLLLFAATCAALVALISHHADDAGINNANGREVANLLGPLGAVAADLLLQTFGFAALAFLAPPAFWGLTAMFGKNMRYAMLRLVAWPLGTLAMAAGLGLFPTPASLPAGVGGMIGIAARALSIHAGLTYHHAWMGIVIPLSLLAMGLPLAFLATGLRFMPLARATANIPAALWWLGSRIRRPQPRAVDLPHDEDSDESEFEDDDSEDSYHLDASPEPLAATRLAERRESRVKRDEAKRAPKQVKPGKQPALNLASGEYQLPALGLLTEAPQVTDNHGLSDEALEENARMLEAVLTDFGVKGRITAVRPGPVVTLYEFEPAAGVKSARVISLADDVARSMSAVSARIAVISGRNVIGIELPNQIRETVYLRELLSTSDYEKARAPLALALGKTIGGEPVIADLAKMPHLLVAGTTGSGKSVGLNTMILSLLYRMAPEQCRMIMIDPKMLELSVYDGIPHLLTAVVTDPRKAVVALKWAVREMEERYRKMSKLGVRGVEAFNDRVRKAKE